TRTVLIGVCFAAKCRSRILPGRGFLDHLNEKAKRILGARFGMDKKNGGAARTFARSFVDQFESARFHGFEGLLRVLHAKGYMRQSAAAAIPLNQFLNGRFHT